MPLAVVASGRHARRHLLMGGTALLSVAAILISGSQVARAQAQTPATNNNIRPDGHTDTRLLVKGNLTEITTATVNGANAYNSFHNFQIGSGNTVNLIIPDSAKSLINIVREGTVVVDGILNSYQRGLLGGHVVFADSYGMIVGQRGVINVGSLTVVTPTRQIIEQMIANGVPNEALVARVLKGDVPLSPDGSVTIKGRVRSQSDVAITAMDVRIAGSLEGAEKAARHKANFQASVNTDGWEGNGSISVRNGEIMIRTQGPLNVDGSLRAGGGAVQGGAINLASASKVSIGASGKVSAKAKADAPTARPSVKIKGETVDIAGKLRADRKANTKAGTIDVAATERITVAATALITAQGSGENSGGGTIRLFADHKLKVADGAQFSVQAGTTGDGGFAELSALNVVEIGQLTVDLSATKGRAGTLLIDPDEIIISGGNGNNVAQYAGTSQTPNLVTRGGSVRLEAKNSITLAADGVIDTTSTTSDAGDITLLAPTIKLLGGGKLDASGQNGFKGGKITLTAEAGTLQTASIEIGDQSGQRVTLKGHDVVISALSTTSIDLTNRKVDASLPKASITIRNADIVATGAVDASAKATMSMTNNMVVAASLVGAEASVDVLGGARITANSVKLSATTETTANGVTGQAYTFNASLDAAAAIVTSISTARVKIAGDAQINATGALELLALNSVRTTANADATKSGNDASGATLAVNVVSATTQISVEDQAVLTAGSLEASAKTDIEATTKTKAAIQGAQQQDNNSQSNQYLNDKKTQDGKSQYSDYATTSDGKLSLAGALSIADVISRNSVSFSSSQRATITNKASLTATSRVSSTLVADGSTTTGADAIGVGIGINLGFISNTALVNQALTAGELQISAVMPANAKNLFSTQVTSGASGRQLGAAGALALNVVDIDYGAGLGASALVNLNGGDFTVKAQAEDDISATALPAGAGVRGTETGVGASIALNVVATRTHVDLADGASLTRAHDVALSADSKHLLTARAEQGVKGGTAITPVVAMNYGANRTSALIGALNGGLVTDGSVSVDAKQLSSMSTEAKGSAGGQTAVGAALAIGIVDNVTRATTAASLSAAGNVRFSASGATLSVTSAIASAIGGRGADAPDNKAQPETQTTAQNDLASSMQRKAGVGDQSQQNATRNTANQSQGQFRTNEGKVTAAAAIGLQVTQSTVEAYVPLAVAIKSGGSLTLTSISNVDAKTSADGEAKKALLTQQQNQQQPPQQQTQQQPPQQDPKLGVGAALAINVVQAKNRAELGSADVLATSGQIAGLTAGRYQAASVAVSALKTNLNASAPSLNLRVDFEEPAETEIDGSRRDQFIVEAVSGSSGAKTSFAGSLALNVIHSDAKASIGRDAKLVLDGVSAARSLLITARNDAFAAASALPTKTGATGTSLGVGASVAMNVITTTSIASMADGAKLTGAKSLTLLSVSDIDTQALAKAGATGGTAIDAVAAMSILAKETTVSIGTGDAIFVEGDSSVTALARGDHWAVAESDAGFAAKKTANRATGQQPVQNQTQTQANSTTIGGSLALITGSGLIDKAQGGDTAQSSLTLAQVNRSLRLTGTLTLSADQSHSYLAIASAMSGGASGSNTDRGTSNNVLASKPASDAMDTQDRELQANKGPDNSKATLGNRPSKLNVAAALSALIVKDRAQVSIGNDAVLEGLRVTLSALGATKLQTLASGETVGDAKTGIGVAVALSLVFNDTSVNLGDRVTIRSGGEAVLSASSHVNDGLGGLTSVAFSGASGDQLSVAGALAIALSQSTTRVKSGGALKIIGRRSQDDTRDLYAGDVTISVSNTSQLAAKAWQGNYTSGGTGIGASVASVISLDEYAVQLGDGAQFKTGKLSVSAINNRVDDIFSSVDPLLEAGSETIDKIKQIVTTTRTSKTDVASESNAQSGKTQTAPTKEADTKPSLIAQKKADLLKAIRDFVTIARDMPLLGRNNYYTEAIGGGLSRGTNAINGSIALQVLLNKTQISLGSSQISAGGAVSFKAVDETVSRTLVGALGLATGGKGVGISLGLVVNRGEVSSLLGKTTSREFSGFEISSRADQKVEVYGGTAGAADQLQVSGALGLLYSSMTSNAGLAAGSDLKGTGAFKINAENDVSAMMIMGGVSASAKDAVGGSVAFSMIDNRTRAHLESTAEEASVVEADSLAVEARASERATNIAAAGGIASNNGIAGVITSLTLKDQLVDARVGAGAQLKANTGGVSVKAADLVTLLNIGGGAAISGENSIGGALGITVITKTVSALVGDGAQIDAAGDVLVEANNADTIQNIVAAGGVSGNMAVNVALGSSAISNLVQASIGRHSKIGQTTRPLSLSVLSSDKTAILDIAGNFGATGGTGVGAGVDVIVLKKNTYAWLGKNAVDETSDANLPADVKTRGNVFVSAQSQQYVYSLVAGLAVGGQAGGAGSVSVYTLIGKTLASIADHARVTADGTVAVQANDESGLNRLVGAIGGGGTAGVGGSIGVTVIDQKTVATVETGAVVDALGNGDGIEVITGYREVLRDYGSDPLAFKAPDQQSLQESNDKGDLSNKKDIAPSQEVSDARSRTGDLFTKQRTTQAVTTRVNGVSVTASASNLVRAIAVGGGGGGTAGISISADIPVLTNLTRASVEGGAQINASARLLRPAKQSARVSAVSDVYSIAIAGALGGGGAAGVGAGVQVSVITNTTEALIGSSARIYAVKDIAIRANSSENAVLVGMSAAGGGTAGVSGSVTGLGLKSLTRAIVEDGTADNHALLSAGRDVLITANDESGFILITGGVSGGGVAGVGLSVSVGVIDKTTTARIGNFADVTALANWDAAEAGANFQIPGDDDKTAIRNGKGLLVAADSRQLITRYIFAGTGGGVAGVGAVVSIEVLTGNVKAQLGDHVTINGSNAGAAADQSVNVLAHDYTVGATIVGGAGGGIAGVAGAIDVAVISRGSEASIGADSKVTARGSVQVSATTRRLLDAKVVSIAAGIGGAGISLAIQTINNSLTKDQADRSNLTTLVDQANKAMDDDTISKEFLSKSSDPLVRDAAADMQRKKKDGVDVPDVSPKSSSTPQPVSTLAEIKSARIQANGSVSVRSIDSFNGRVDVGAAMGGAGAGIGIGVTVVDIANTARISNGAQVEAGSVDVKALTKRSYGAVTVSGAAIGGAVAVGAYSDMTKSDARISGAQVSANGNVTVDAKFAADSGKIAQLFSFALAAGVGASTNILVLKPVTEAVIENNAVVKGAQVQQGTVAVTANTDVSYEILSMGLVLAGGSAGISVVSEEITTRADIAHSTVKAGILSPMLVVGSVDVEATTTEVGTITGIGVAMLGGAGGAIGTVTRKTLTEALIDAGDVFATGNVIVKGQSNNQLDFVSGAGALAVGPAGAASLGVSLLTTITNAAVSGIVDALGHAPMADVTTSYAADFKEVDASSSFKANLKDKDGNQRSPVLTNDLVETTGENLIFKDRISTPVTKKGAGLIINALTTEVLHSSQIGGAAGMAGAAAMSVNVPMINNSTSALIKDGARINTRNQADANAMQSVTVAAASDLYLRQIVGGVSLSGTLGAGGSIAVLYVSNNTKASIGKGVTTNARLNVNVSALASEDIASIVFAGAASMLASLSGGLTVATIQNNTSALIEEDAQVVAGNNVTVEADDTTRAGIASGAFSAAAAGAAGAAISVTSITKDTRALIKAGAKVSGLAGASGAVNQFDALVANSIFSRKTQGILVSARSRELVYTLIGAASGALGVSLAGSIGVQKINTVTIAEVQDRARLNEAAGGTSRQEVVVNAEDNIGITTKVGGFSGGVVGLAGAIDVGIINNTTRATLGGDYVSGNGVDVLARSNRQISSNVLSVGAGLGVALAASISVYTIGDVLVESSEGGQKLKSDKGDLSASVQKTINNEQNDPSTVTTDQLIQQLMDKSISDKDKNTDQSTLSGAQSKGGATQEELSKNGKIAADQLKKTDASLKVVTTEPGGTRSELLAKRVISTGKVAVAGRSETGFKVGMTTASASGIAALGAGIAVFDNYSKLAVTVRGSTITATDVFVNAKTGNTVNLTAVVGGGSVLFAGQAALASANDATETETNLADSRVNASGRVVVAAEAIRDMTLKSDGESFAGLAAAGAGVSRAYIAGKVTAEVARSVIGQWDLAADPVGAGILGGAKSIEMSAKASGTVISTAIASSGGIGMSGAGADSKVIVKPIVQSTVTSSRLAATDMLRINSIAEYEAQAISRGLAVAVGLSVGVSLATVEVAADVGTSVSDSFMQAGNAQNAGDIEITSAFNTLLAKTEAIGSGGAIIGVNAVTSDVSDKSKAATSVTRSKLLSFGAFKATAESHTNNFAKIDGRVGGLLAAGATNANSSTATITTVDVSGLTFLRARNLIIWARSYDGQKVDGYSGSGGVISGAAITGRTEDRSATSVNFVAPSDITLDLTDNDNNTVIEARHESTFSGYISSVNASVAGGSGARLFHTVRSNVTAKIGDGTHILATHFKANAFNLVKGVGNDRNRTDIESGSGGLFDLPATRAQTDIELSTTLMLGKNVRIDVSAPATGGSIVDLQAYNDIYLRKSIKLDSGGAIPIAKGENEVTASMQALVVFDNGATLVIDKGDLRVAAFSKADIDLSNAVMTAGLAGAPSGATKVNLTNFNAVMLGKEVRIETTRSEFLGDPAVTKPSYGTMRFSAGADLDGNEVTSSIVAGADLFNNTAIPMSGAPDVQITIVSNANVQVDTVTKPNDPKQRYGITSANDIHVKADRGIYQTRARGEGTNIYLEALAAAGTAISKLFGGKEVSLKLTSGSSSVTGVSSIIVDGYVEAGIQRSQTLTISYQPTQTGNGLLLEGSIQNVQVRNGGGSGTNLLRRLTELKELKSRYAGDGFATAAYESEIQFIWKKLVGMGLAVQEGGNFRLRDGVTGGSLGVQGGGTPLQLSLTAFSNVVGRDILTDVLSITNLIMSSWDSNNPADYVIKRSLEQTIAFLNSNKGDGWQARKAVLESVLIEARNAVVYYQVMTMAAGTLRSQMLNQVQALSDIVRNAVTDKTIDVARSFQEKMVDILSKREEIADLINGSSRTVGIRQTVQFYLDQIKRASDLTVPDVFVISGPGTKMTGLLLNGNYLLNGIVDPSIESSRAQLTDQTVKRLVDQYVTDTKILKGEQIGGLSSEQWKDTLLDAINGKASILPGMPNNFTVEVPRVIAYGANIYLTANQVTTRGPGSLNAPADLKIWINNKTHASLVLSDLIIPDYDIGKIRVNGVEIFNGTDITDVTNVASNFQSGKIITYKNTGLPEIKIWSEYNPGSTSFYVDPASEDARQLPASAWWKNILHSAPDIELTTNKTITNNKGSVDIASDAGNISLYGSVRAGTIKILARNGDMSLGYVNDYRHMGGDPKTGQPIGVGLLANGDINIAARYINLNSRVQSGIVKWEVTFTQNSLVTIDKNNAADFGLDVNNLNTMIDVWLADPNRAALPTKADLGNGIQLDYVTKKLIMPMRLAETKPNTYQIYRERDTDVGGTFNSVTKRIEVDMTAVRGGYIRVFGQIFNTSQSGGELNVLDGFGTIKIDNQTNYDLKLQVLDTGKDSDGNGRGTKGEIDIMDVQPEGNLLKATHTIFTRDYDSASQGNARIKVVVEKGELNPYSGAFNVTSTQTSYVNSDRSTSYDVKDGLHYNWQNGTDTTKVEVWNTYSLNWFHSDALQTFQSSAKDPNDRISVTNYTPDMLPQGYFLSNGNIIDPNDVTSHVLTNTRTVTNTDFKILSQTISCNWWTLCIATNVNSTVQLTYSTSALTTTSMRADYNIGINFIGENRGDIDVTSKKSIILGDNINNYAGATKLTSAEGVITQSMPSTKITSRSVDLTAKFGVGALNAPINLSLLADSYGNGRYVSATTDAGPIELKSSGDLVLRKIEQKGIDGLMNYASLWADGSILRENSNTLVSAPRIVLTAVNGVIGGYDSLHIETGTSNDANLRANLGLTANASGNIYIHNSRGNLLIKQVRSRGGDVTLSTTGRMIDNEQEETINQRSYQELVAYWDSLGLTAGRNNDDRRAQIITTFENSKTQDYRQYWQLRVTQADGGRSFDPNFRVTYVQGSAQYNALRDYFTQQRIAANNGTRPTGLDELVAGDIARRADEQTQAYRQLHASFGGVGDSFNSQWRYVASDAERSALLKGSTWSEDTLGFSISPGALKTITNTNVIIKQPNVAGRNVTLFANGIGEPGASLSIKPTDRPASRLTDAEKVALATAERSDLVLVVGGVQLPNNPSAEQRAAYDAAVRLGIHNKITRVPLGKELSDMTATERAAYDALMQGLVFGSTLTALEVGSKRPLNFSATDRLMLTIAGGPTLADPTRGSVYLATLGDALIAHLNTSNEVRIKAQGSIKQVNLKGDTKSGDFRTGDLILEAATGSIGSADAPILLEAADMPTADGTRAGNITARAQNGVWLKGKTDLVIDTVYSPNAIWLAASGSVINAYRSQLITLLGSSIHLTADRGSIGSSGRKINIGLTTDKGEIFVKAGSDVYLYGPMQTKMLFSSIEAGGALSVESGQDITIKQYAKAPGNITLTSAKALKLGDLAFVRSSAGNISIDAGSFSMDAGTWAKADAGSVFILTQGDARISNVEAGAQSPTAISVTARNGRLIAGLGAQRGFDLKALNGGVVLIAGGSIGAESLDGATYDAATDRFLIASQKIETHAGGDTLITALNEVTSAKMETTLGSIDIDARSHFKGAEITANNGNVTLIAQGDIGISLVKATGDQLGTVIIKTEIGSLTGGNVSGDGSVTLFANNDNTGGDASSTRGDISLTSANGKIEWNKAIAGGKITGIALKGLIHLGTANAAGSIYLESGDEVVFDDLTTSGTEADRGDITVISPNARTRGGQINFAHGALTITAAGIDFGNREFYAEAGMTLTSSLEIKGDRLRTPGFIIMESQGDTTISSTKSETLSTASPSSIYIGSVEVVKQADFAGNYVEVGRLTHRPIANERLLMSLTGYKDALGRSSKLYVDAANGIDITRLREIDANIETNASSVHTREGLIDHTFSLTTSVQWLWMNNWTPRPLRMDDTQLYSPGRIFFLYVDNWRTDTSSYVVQYWNEKTQILDFLEGNYWLGASMVRDFDRQGRNGANGPLIIWSDTGIPVRTGFPVDAFNRHLDRLRQQRIRARDGGPAVNSGSSAANINEAFRYRVAQQRY